jgi:hypothetical protein
MKVIARELIWFFIALILASPVAYYFSYIVGLEPEGVTLTMEEEVFQMEFFIIGYIIGIMGTYLMRVVLWAVSTYLIETDS